MKILIGFSACHQSIAGNQKIIPFVANYTNAAIQLQGFQRKEKKLKIFIERFFNLTKKLSAFKRSKKNNQILSQQHTYRNIKPQEIHVITQFGGHEAGMSCAYLACEVHMYFWSSLFLEEVKR